MSYTVPSLSYEDVTDSTIEDWKTSCLDRKCPSQVGNVYDRPVSFQVQSVCMYGLLGDGILVVNYDRLGSSSRQDSNSIGQDGKCDQQAVEIHDRTVFRWVEPRSGYRVVEGHRNIKHV